MKAKNFFINMAKGAAIGTAVIIPGVSGGTLAVLLGVYDDLIKSVSNLFKEFKKSFFFLLPVLLGAALAFAALYLPIKYALQYAPFPTITLFTGLMLGSIPDLVKKSNQNGFKKTDTIGMVLACAAVIAICFLPNVGNVDLSTTMPVWGYFVLIVMGMLASCALVVPGISGSMLLMVFGYYTPIINTISGLKTSFGHSLLVLALFALGLVVGFFTIAKLMQLLLNKFRRATFWTIVGFVIGSLPAVIITFFNQFGHDLSRYLAPWQIAVAVVLFVAGAIASFFLTRYAEKHAALISADGTEAEIAANTETDAGAETPQRTVEQKGDGGESDGRS